MYHVSAQGVDERIVVVVVVVVDDVQCPVCRQCPVS